MSQTASENKVFDSRFAALLLCFSLPLIFLPKINLISFEGQTAGLRMDDLMLIIFAAVYVWGCCALPRPLLTIEKIVFTIVAFSCLSFAINRLLVASGYLYVHASIFYSIRLLEYFLFFYVGMLASRFISLGVLLRGLVLWNLLFMLLQYFQFIGVFSVEGYISHAEDSRLLGIASFGAEMGLMLNLLFCSFLYEERTLKLPFQLFPQQIRHFFQVNKAFLYLLLFIGLVVLTGARIAIAALLVTFLLRIKGLIRWRAPTTYIMPLLTLALAVSLMLYMLYNVSGIISRSEGLLSLSNLELIPIVWDNIVLDYDPIGKESVSYDGYDASWWMRIHKWCYALKIYSYHPLCWLQGVGPGFAMPALDGGIIRIVAELGLIGAFLYAYLFYTIGKMSILLKWMVFTMAVNMLFFDVHIAYKPMSLLFLVTGYAYAENKKRD